jgi:hypothetical protein
MMASGGKLTFCGSELWRGVLPPLGCEAAPNALRYQESCECYALKRGQAPSPQIAPTGVDLGNWRR